jgi:hypothetical protein
MPLQCKESLILQLLGIACSIYRVMQHWLPAQTPLQGYLVISWLGLKVVNIEPFPFFILLL